MKLKDYIKGLQEFVIDNPKSAQMEVVTSSDEGNSYRDVCFTPCIGHFNSDDAEFYELRDLDDEDRETYKDNAVCVN